MLITIINIWIAYVILSSLGSMLFILLGYWCDRIDSKPKVYRVINNVYDPNKRWEG